MKFSIVNTAEIGIRESRGLVKDIYDPTSAIREPLSEYRTMLDLIHSDNTLATAFDIIVDFATYRGFDFIGGTKIRRDELRTLFDDLNWQQVQTNLLYSMLYYGDAFLELRRNNSNKPNELWVLETTEMRIKFDKNGKVEGYIQRPFKLDGLTEQEVLDKEQTMGIFFKPEEVIHFRMKWIGSQVYSYNPNEPMLTEAKTKIYSSNYLYNIFINMPPRYVAHLAGISTKDFVGAKKEFQSTKTNYKKTIAFSRSSDPASKLQLQKIDPPYDKTLIDIIKWLNQEMLKVTRVPRSWVEESGTENRGVTEAEQRPFDVRIGAIHNNMIEPMINMKLLPSLGYSKKPTGSEKKLRFKYNEISRKGETEILANATSLQAMGLKPLALKRYLDDRGILGIDEDDFQDLNAMKAGVGMSTAKDKDSFPSRKRMNKSIDDMTQNRNEAGVSDEGGKKIQQEAMA